MKIKVLYFAKLREERGCSEESIELNVNTAKELYEELKVRHKFSMPIELLKIAINDEFSSWDSPIRENDVVAFIQPVAGG